MKKWPPARGAWGTTDANRLPSMVSPDDTVREGVGMMPFGRGGRGLKSLERWREGVAVLLAVLFLSSFPYKD